VVVPWLEPFFEQIREQSRSGLGEVSFDVVLQEGRGLSLVDAVALGLDLTATPVSEVSGEAKT
jgi:hypothetical protein